jgi:hypothetical protein
MALQIEPVKILDSRYQEINYFSLNNPVAVNLVFNYTLAEGETFTNILVDAVDIYPDGIYSGNDYSKQAPVCKGEGGKYSCISSIIMKAKNSTFNITVKGTYSASLGTVAVENSTLINLNADNSRPQATFLGTEYCNGEKCYVASDKRTDLKMIMQDERATFTKVSVGFKVGTKTVLGNECTDMTCIGDARITCQDNQILSLNIWHNGIISKDDLGNKINGSSVNLTCDASPPVIKAHQISSAIGTNTLVIDKDILLEFNATDIASPVLNITVNADSVAAGNVTAECTKPSVNGINFICRAIVTPAVDQPGQYEFKVQIEDIVGRVAKESLNLNIMKTTNETINLWHVSGVEQSTNTFSRPNLEFERTLFAKVNVQPSGTAEIVSIAPEGKCYAAVPNVSGIDSDIVSVKSITKQGQSLYLKIAVRENNDGRYDKIANLTFNCPVSISSKKGNYYYSTPEKDNFTINIVLKDELNIQQRHENEINRTTKNIEDNLKTLNSLNKMVSYANGICAVCGGMSEVTAILSSVEAIMGVYPPTKSAAIGLGATTDGLQTGIYSGICENSDRICQFVTCKSDVQTAATSWMGESLGGENGVYKTLGYENAASSLDPYKSYFVAVATLCVPAIAYHYNTYVGIQCNYLDCISNDYVKYGQDISTCQQDKAFSECMYWSGGALDAIPFVSMFRDITTRIGGMMKDPVQLFGFALPFACRPFKTESIVHGACVTVQEVFSVARSVTTLNDMATQVTKMFQNNGITANCGTVIANSKLAYTKKTQVGYSNDDYNPTKHTDNKEITCTGGDCKYKGALGEYTMRVIDTGETKNGEEVYDVLYYNGNKKVNPLDAKSYADYVRTAPTSNEYKAYQSAQAKVLEAKAALAKIDGSNKINEINKAKVDLAAAEGDLVAAKNKVPANELVPTEYSEEDLDNTIGAAAIKLDKQSRIELEERFGIKAEMLAVSKAQYDYASFIKKGLKTKQDNEQRLADEKALKKLLDRPEDKLSDKEKTKIKQLRESLQASVASTEYNAVKNAEKAVADAQLAASKAGGSTGYEKALSNVHDAELKLNDAKKNLDAKTKNYDFGSDADIAKINAEIDSFNAELKTKRQALKEAMTNEKFTKYFGSWTATTMSAWGNVNAVAGMRSFLNMNWGKFNPGGKMAQAGDFLIEDVSQFEKAWCSAAIKPSQRLGDTVIMNSITSDSFRTGAQVGGRKSKLVNDGTKSYYEYWVQGNVITSKRDGLIIKVIMVDSQGKETDMTTKILGETTPLQEGVQFVFGRPSVYYFTDTSDYEKICLKFEGGSLSSYFDHVSGNGDRICQKLIVE